MNRKIIWKFNIIDILLIAILAISLIALVYKLTWGKASGETHSYTFTYVCTSAPGELTDNLEKGVLCADGDNGTELGTLSYIKTEEPPVPAASAESLSPGSSDDDEEETPSPTATAAPPENVKLILKSTPEGKSVKHGIEIEDALYLKGKTFPLIVDQTLFDVYISDITQND